MHIFYLQKKMYVFILFFFFFFKKANLSFKADDTIPPVECSLKSDLNMHHSSETKASVKEPLGLLQLTENCFLGIYLKLLFTYQWV